MNFYGRTEAVEQAFSNGDMRESRRKENCLRYAVDTSAFTDGERDDSEDGMEPLEVFIMSSILVKCRTVLWRCFPPLEQ